MGSVFSSPEIDFELLKKQNAKTSSAIIEFFTNNREFDKLSKYEGELTLMRDKEDDMKLQKGIDYAKSKGVIDPNYIPEPYINIDVLGKTPDEVADIILESVKSNQKAEKSDSKGSVIVLVGLSGTGKGTTVSCLREKLQQRDGKQVVTWSNGNIFRAVTLLAATYCEQNNNCPLEKALTKENLQKFMGMLSFGKFKGDDGKFDTKIEGLGLLMYISEVENTELKQPKVSKNIPTVAEVTQGEVILFAAGAVEIMQKDGIVVLLEGREQTVNYVRSPHRFNLILSDETLIGKRRAAQRIMGDALKALSSAPSEENSTTTSQPSVEAIEAALVKSLQTMVADIM